MEKYLNKFEYNKILDNLQKHCKTYIGKDLALDLKPSTSQENVKKLLAETTEGLNLLSILATSPIDFISEIDIWIKQLESDWILNTKGLLDLAIILKMSRELKEYFFCDNIDSEKFPILNEYFDSLYANIQYYLKIL